MMNIQNSVFSYKNLIFLLYIFLCITLYFVSINIVIPLKIIVIPLNIIVLVYIYILVKVDITLNYITLFWIFSIFPFTFSLLYSVNFSMSLQFVLVYIASIFLFVLITFSNKTMKIKFLNIHYYFSILLMIITLISWLLPGIFNYTFFPFLNEGAQRTYKYFRNMNELAGISGQTGTNAFLLTVGFSFVLFRKKNFKNILLTLLFAVVIIMSTKRGIILANLGAYLFVMILIIKFTKKKVLISFFLLISLIISLWVFLSKINNFNLNNFSSNRLSLYSSAMNSFKENYWIGTGINTYSSQSLDFKTSLEQGLNAHNVYIQLLSEVGIIGFLVYLFVQISTLIYTIKRYKSFIKVGFDEMQTYLLSIIYFQIFFIIYSLMGNPLYDYNFFLIYLLLIGSILNTNTGDD